ncbi:hypothetical protein FKW77_004866 [Venturia effusa]|uniref:Uncharacterized protein n=1 Tax=Venturia effusa TaxID=50376 RepID=A0A517LQ30_9PEZI|nr:hypothetical protein FKW77_004866 [Venturia effusa]
MATSVWDLMVQRRLSLAKMNDSQVEKEAGATKKPNYTEAKTWPKISIVSKSVVSINTPQAYKRLSHGPSIKPLNHNTNSSQMDDLLSNLSARLRQGPMQLPPTLCATTPCANIARWVNNPANLITCPKCSQATCLQCIMSPPKKYSKGELDSRCKRCFAPATAQDSGTVELSQSGDMPVDIDLNGELDRTKQRDILFAQFRDNVNMDEGEALETFLKLLEERRDGEPTASQQLSQ